MSFVAALPTKAAPAAHPAGARAALHATAAANDFSALLDDGQDPATTSDASTPTAKPSKTAPGRTPAAGAASPAASASTPASSVQVAVLAPLVSPAPSPQPQAGAAGAASATTRASPPLSEPSVAASLALAPTTVKADDDEGDEAPVEASASAVSAHGALAGAPDQGGTITSIPPPPTGTGRTTAQTLSAPAATPLLQAASAAGATLVKAQATTPGGKTAATAPSATAKAAQAASGAVANGPAATGGSAAVASAAPPAGPPPADTASALLAAFSGTGDEPGDGDAKASGDRDDASLPPDAAQTDIAGGFTPFAAAVSPSTQAGATSTPLSASAADLAAQMAAKVQGGASQFKLSLNPLGLGQVDVTVSIGADRQLTASLAFSDPQTAHALSAHAAELKGALEQAGFTIPKGGFDFTGTASAQAASAGGAHASGAQLSGGGFGGAGGGQGGGARAGRAAFAAGEPLGGQLSSDAAGAGAADSRLDIRI